MTGYVQMTSVFESVARTPVSTPKPFRLRSSSPAAFEPADVSAIARSTADEQTGMELCDVFSALNVSALHRLGGGDVLLEVCDMALVYLKRYRANYEEDIASDGAEMALPLNLSDALSVRMRSIGNKSVLFSGFKVCETL